MNPELPNSIRSALAQKGAVTTHPSADLLTAFTEHTLSTGEKERIADHLALCSECRETLFLAGSAGEQHTAEVERAANAAPRPRARWMPRLAWLVSGAGIAIGGGILVQQYLARDSSSQKVAQATHVATQQTPIISQPEPSSELVIAPEATKPTSERTLKSSGSDRNSPRESSDIVAKKSAPPSGAKSPDIAAAPSARAVNPPPGIVVGGPAGSFQAATPMQNSFAQRPEGSQTQDFTVSQLPALQALMRRGSATKTWRVNPEGHLEHSSQTGWMGVLTEQPVEFQVVSESHNGVWAGGNRGELFHSEDDGEHWSEIALPGPAGGKNDAIVAIHFTDLQHGIILTESGTRYTTSDGGKNWQRD